MQSITLVPYFFAGSSMRYSETVDIARVFWVAGDLAVRDGNLGLAECHYKKAEAFLAHHIPQSQPAHALAAMRLSELYCKQDRLTEAITHANSAIGILTATLGVRHPSTALALHHLAEILELQKLNSVAKAVRRRSAQMLGDTITKAEPPTPNHGQHPNCANRQL